MKLLGITYDRLSRNRPSLLLLLHRCLELALYTQCDLYPRPFGNQLTLRLYPDHIRSGQM